MQIIMIYELENKVLLHGLPSFKIYQEQVEPRQVYHHLHLMNGKYVQHVVRIVVRYPLGLHQRSLLP